MSMEVLTTPIVLVCTFTEAYAINWIFEKENNAIQL